MYKTQKIKLCLNSCEHRLNKQTLTLYSYDINNNIIEIKIVDEEDDLIKLSNYNVEILSVFSNSKKKWSHVPKIEDDKILFTFDTGLIDRDETVKCHVYISKLYDDGSIESADVAVFDFRVRLSQIHVDMQEKPTSTRKAEYEHNQTYSSNEWHIVHNLKKYPQVTVLDSALNEVVGAVQHLSKNELIIRFSAPFTGQAQLD